MSNPSVTRSEGWEAYTVRADGEWATIMIRGWRYSGADTRAYEAGEIMIHSSFGAWAHQWGHLGEPFKEWLSDPKLERGYLATKFLKDKAVVFDGEKTVRHLRQSLIEHRRCTDLTKSDARTIWDWIRENESYLESSESEFVEVMQGCVSDADWKDAMAGRPDWDTGPGIGARHFLEEPWDRISRSVDPQFAGFWRDLWPHFQEHLRSELTASESAADGGDVGACCGLQQTFSGGAIQDTCHLA